MAESVLDVVAKDIEKQHVARHVRPARVHKHGHHDCRRLTKGV
jgi:hypothetical protein